MEERMPWIEWREPVEVSLMDGSQRGLACRYCIGMIAQPGSGSRPLPDAKTFEQHMREQHGITS